MAGFIQFVEFEADDVEALKDALVRFRTEHPEVVTAVATKVAEDRDRPGTYVAINEFESYDKAMEQSSSPHTTQFSQKMENAMKGRSFRNLDVLYDLGRP